MKFLAPEGLANPKGYAHGVACSCDGYVVFISGQIGWLADRTFPDKDIAGQVRHALTSVVRILLAAGGRPKHVARMTWYVTDKKEYLAAQREIGEAYREIMGAHYPAMSVIEVSALLEDEAKVEIEATAMVPK